MILPFKSSIYLLLYSSSLEASGFFAACIFPTSLLSMLIELSMVGACLWRLPMIWKSYMKPLILSIQVSALLTLMIQGIYASILSENLITIIACSLISAVVSFSLWYFAELKVV